VSHLSPAKFVKVNQSLLVEWNTRNVRCSTIIITIMIRYMLIGISIFMLIFFLAVRVTT